MKKITKLLLTLLCISGSFFLGQAQCPVGETAYVVSITTSGFPSEIHYVLSNTTTGDTVSIADCGTISASFSDTVCLVAGDDYCFDAYDDWGDGWNGGSFSVSELASGTVVVSGTPSNGLPGDGAAGCGGSQLEQTACFTEGIVAGCTDSTAVNYNPAANFDDGSCLFAPSNDDCANAIAILCGDTASGTTAGASNDTSLGTCGTSLISAPGVWYAFAGDGSPVTASLCGSTFDTKIGVFEGSCDSLICLAGNDDLCGLQSEVTFNSLAGTNYYIYVTGFSSQSGDFTMTFTCAILGCTDSNAINYNPAANVDDGSCIYPPANDDCANATVIACGDSVTGTTIAATANTVGFCSTTLSTAPGVWYVHTGQGGTATASLCGSDFDTKIGVYEGPCDSLSCIAGNDDACGLQSELTFASTAGTTYYIFVTGFGSASGNYALALSCDIPISGCTDSTAINYNPNATIDDGSCQFGVNVTLIVDMCNEVVDTAGVYVAGTFNGFDPTATQMTNIGGTQYSATIVETPGNSIQYKYLNGPSFAGEETVPSACGIDNGFGAFDRGFVVPANDTTAGPVAFGSCDTCVVPTNVTFIVNMCSETVDSNGVYLAGSFNGFNASADQMLPIGGDRYSVTIAMTAGQSHTYKHLNGPDFAGAEIVPDSCGQPDGFGQFNRSFTVPVSDTTLGPVRFGSCTEDCPLCDPGQVTHVLTITGGSFPAEIGFSLINSTTGDTAVLASCGSVTGAGISDTICLDDGADYCFTAYDDWGDGWNGGTFALTKLDNGAIIISGSPNNGTAGDNSDLCDGSQVEDSVCFTIGIIAGCTDSTAVNYNPSATVDDGSCIYPPSNDDCDGAIDLTVGVGPCSSGAISSNAGATFSASAGSPSPACVDFGFNMMPSDIWYSATFTDSALIFEILNQPGFSAVVELYVGVCDTLIKLDSAFCTNFGNNSPLTINGFPGAQIYFRIWDFGNDQFGDFEICAYSPAAAPANDDCAAAIAVACGDSISGSTASATPDAVGTCGTALNTAGGVWYSFAGNGDTVTASLCGSSFDTKIGVFDGTCDTLNCVAGNDDACGLQSEVSFVSTTGTTYYILVTGFAAQTGNFNLQISCAPVVGCGIPQNLMAPTATGSGNVTLSWNAVANATSYTVRGKRADLATIYTFNTSMNSIDLTGLTPGKDHYWQVKANCPAEMSAYSGIDTFNIDPCTAPDSTWTTGVTSTTATANWSPVPDAYQYLVYANRIGSGVSGTVVIVVNAPTTSLTGSNLTPGASYQYAVRARCAPGGQISGPSPIDTFTATNAAAKTGEAFSNISNVTLKLYPNPASSQLNIDLSSFEAIEDVSITIFDLKGQQVYQLSGQTINNSMNINLPSEMVNGVYQVHVNYADKHFNEKLIIVR